MKNHIIICICISFVCFNVVSAQSLERELQHIRYPKINPINPDLFGYNYGKEIHISYKTLDNKIIKISCNNNNNNEEISLYGPSDESSEEVRTKCDYFDWRPVADYDNRFWYIYISYHKRKIIAGYVKINKDEKIIDQEFDIRSFEGEVSRPLWSPDGQYIIYRDGNTLKLLSNLYKAISNNDMQLIKSDDIANDLFFPSWSNNSRFIVAEYSPDISLSTNDLKIVDLSKFQTGDEQYYMSSVKALDKAKILQDDYQIAKPVWSFDDKYLSVLIESYVQGQWDIIMLEVIKDDNGDILGLENQNYIRSRSIVSNISRPDLRYGFPIFALGDNNPSIAYFENNPANNYPFIIQDIKSRRTISPDSTNQNRDLNLIKIKDRYVASFVHQNEGAYRLNRMIISADSTYTIGALPANIASLVSQKKELNSNKIKLLSGVFPGAGQIHKGEVVKGISISLLFTSFVGTSIYLNGQVNGDIMSYNNMKGNYLNTYNYNNSVNISDYTSFINNRTISYQQLKYKKDTIKNNQTYLTVVLIAALSTYIYNLLDVLNDNIYYKEGTSKKLKIQPYVKTSRAKTSNYFNTGISIKRAIN